MDFGEKTRTLLIFNNVSIRKVIAFLGTMSWDLPVLKVSLNITLIIGTIGPLCASCDYFGDNDDGNRYF
jgi:hypothetical protein